MAGPVVAAAVYAPSSSELIALARDSKKLSASQRNAVYEQLKADKSIVSSFAVVDNRIIDEVNILQASLKAMKLAIDDTYSKIQYLNLSLAADPGQFYAFIDGNKCPHPLPIKSRAIVKGDSLCYSIALASIVAKVERDKIMEEFDLDFPHYGFAKHKGYPTREHTLALHKFGASSIHRMTFKPVRGREASNSPMLIWTAASET